MILAVLQQHCGIALHDHDVFASTVGGARLTEPATDLAIAVALASAGTGGAPAAAGVVALGEIGLAGEVRRVRDLPQRLAEAARLGFRVGRGAVHRAATAAGRASTTVDGMTVLEAGRPRRPALRPSLGLAKTGRRESHPLD